MTDEATIDLKAEAKRILCGIQTGSVLGVTGHRPQRLGGFTEDAFLRLVSMASATINYAAPAKVITGMAVGWDMAVAQACAQLKVPFVVALPFSFQSGRWSLREQDRYNNLLSLASEIVNVSPGDFEYWKMEMRNRWIVDHCDAVLALWDGQRYGGTASCVAYAEGKKRNIYNMHSTFKLVQEQALHQARRAA